jgi:hypothetical protein
MDKNLWKSRINDAACPMWPCSTCRAGVLQLDKGSLRHTTTNKSMAEQNEDWWGPEHVVMSFTAWAKCSTCGESFALAGTGSVEVVQDENFDTDYIDVFDLKYCHPTLNIIPLSNNWPDGVRDALVAAFSLYWTDRPSAAGRIRVALERLLDHLGIAGTGAKGNYLTLDTRIDLFTKNDVVHGPYLMAIKWLGNVGAHTVDVMADDILDAFDVLEHVLGEVVDKKSAAIAKLAADIIKRHKP